MEITGVAVDAVLDRERLGWEKTSAVSAEVRVRAVDSSVGTLEALLRVEGEGVGVTDVVLAPERPS